MPRYKRNAAEAELDISTIEAPTPSDPTHMATLTKLRNMWEFASLMQYIYLFGSVVKIDENFDIEDLEQECLQLTPSETLAAVGLALLKYVSSHRGLTPEIFAEYTRRQYLAKLPAQNPFGDEEEPTPFNDLDIYTRVRVLQQLSTWTFGNADRIRGLMPEGEDDLTWRMEPLGWDADDRAYFVLDDNRLYRRTDELPPPPTPPKTKQKSKTAPKKSKKPLPKPSRGTRASKRRRVDDSSEPEEETPAEEADTLEDTAMENGGDTEHITEEAGYGFTSKTWECIAITLGEYQDFLSTIQRSRDPNEKTLRRRIEEDVLPILEKRAEAIRQKQLKKLRELENIQKMATAKRSSRLADKADKQAKEDEERQEELRKAAELRMAREEQEKARRIEEGHESRRLTREQRLKEREVKRILHEEELARLDREASTTGSHLDGHEADGAASERKRLSSRNLQNQQEAHRKELERLTQDQEEDKWYFDCVVCGMHGENLDDGSHSVACERCNVWQHSKCHGFTPEQCENENFHFICNSCRKKEKAAKDEKSGLVLKLGKQNSSPSSVRPEPSDTIAVAQIKKETALPDFVQQQLNGLTQQRVPPSHQQQQYHAHQPSSSPAQHQQYPLQQPGSSPVQHQQYQYQQYRMQQQGSSPPHHHQLPPQRESPSQQHQHGTLLHPPTLAPSAPRSGVYQQSPQQQHAQAGPSPLYQARGFAGTPPQRTQAPALMASDRITSGMEQHNWVHYNAVNGSMPRQQDRTPQYPPSPQRATPQPHYQHAVQGHPSQRPPSRDYVNNGTPQLAQQSPHLPSQSAQRAPQSQQTANAALPSSPHTSLLPPPTSYSKQAAVSPIKSSPPRSLAPSPGAHLLNGHASFSGNSHNTASPGSSFDNAPKLATPIKATEIPVSPAQNATDIAANGMKGPWPTGSLSVPHKHDSVVPSAQSKGA